MMTKTAMMVAAAILAWVEGEARVGREYSEAYLETAIDADPEIKTLGDEEYAAAFGDAMNYLCELGVMAGRARRALEEGLKMATAIMAKGSGLDADEMAVERDRREAETGITFDAAIARWHVLAQAMMDEHYTEQGRGRGVRLTLDPGRRYVRVWKGDTNAAGELVELPSRGSAYAFIDTMTGDVLKPDGWKKPAKHARGNIWDENPIAWCGVYGIAGVKRGGGRDGA